MALRYYSNAPATTLSASCTNVATSIQVTSVAGLPIQYPYVLILDRGLATEEAVSVTAAAGTTLTVTRGYDSTTAFAHSIGASVAHGITAADAREANSHVNASSAVHGLTGSVVGTSDTQTLTNKTVNLSSNTLSGTKAQFNTALSDGDFASQAGTETLTNKTIALGSNTVSGTKAQFDTACTDADFATLAASETLTNKTIALGSNTVSGTTAQFNTALTDNDFATLAGTETLSNKTLASPVITGIGAVQFTRKTADETVTSSTAVQNDDHLSFTVVNGGVYTFRAVIFAINTGSSSADAQVGFTFISLGTMIMGLVAPDVAVASEVGDGIWRHTASGGALATPVGVTAGGVTIVIEGVFTATAAGTVQFQWAQNTSSASGTTFKAGSWLRAERVA